MNYLKICTDKILIAINGYKTPDSVIKKLPDYKYLIENPPWQSKKKQ
jgi:hypothetical protein